MKWIVLGSVAVASVPFLSGCSLLADLPRDARGSTRLLQSGKPLVVGVPERAEADDAAVAAREKALLEKLARRLGTRVEWKKGNAHRLLQDLEEAQVMVVAAQLSSDTPFASEVAMSQPFWKHGPREKDFCMAVAPGENKLLFELDKLIAQDQKERGAALGPRLLGRRA